MVIVMILVSLLIVILTSLIFRPLNACDVILNSNCNYELWSIDSTTQGRALVGVRRYCFYEYIVQGIVNKDRKTAGSLNDSNDNAHDN